MSAFVDPTTRVSVIEGTSVNNFQIPDRPGQLGVAPVITSFRSGTIRANGPSFGAGSQLARRAPPGSERPIDGEPA
jgi:hypothetical protein